MIITAFIIGLISGFFVPHAHIYAKVCKHFMKAMRFKQQKMYECFLEKGKLRKRIKQLESKCCGRCIEGLDECPYKVERDFNNR